MNNKCSWCGKVIESTDEFCSPKCRYEFSRVEEEKNKQLKTEQQISSIKNGLRTYRIFIYIVAIIAALYVMTPKEARERVINKLSSELLSGQACSNPGENLVYYYNPSELIALGEDAYGRDDIYLNGVVKEGSLKRDEKSNTLTFEISDGKSHIKVYTQTSMDKSMVVVLRTKESLFLKHHKDFLLLGV